MTVTFAAWAGNTDIPAWEELERTYEEQNPKVDVVTAPSCTGADYCPALQTNVAGGEPPLVAYFRVGSGSRTPMLSVLQRWMTTSPRLVSRALIPMTFKAFRTALCVTAIAI